MMVKMIKSIVELPDWFSLRKYDKAGDLNYAGWHEQFSARFYVKHVFHFGDGQWTLQENDPEAYKKVVDLLRRKPIIDVEKDSFPCIRPLVSLIESGQYSCVSGIRLMTFDGLCMRTSFLPEDKRKELEKNYLAIANGDLFPEERPPDWLSLPIHEVKNGRNIILDVDVSVSEDLLIKQFLAILAVPRKKYLESVQAESNNIKNISCSDFIRYAVLPYLDLAMWSEEKSIKIPNRVMADAIFPLGQGGEEVIRKTTVPLAKRVLESTLIEHLKDIAIKEALENRNH